MTTTIRNYINSNYLNSNHAADLVATVTRFGAATIVDLSLDLGMHRESVRKRLTALVDAGKLVMIEAASKHSGALYGMPDLDEQAEFDLYRTRTNNWPRGQHGRDWLVEAMFGAPAVEVRT